MYKVPLGMGCCRVQVIFIAFNDQDVWIEIEHLPTHRRLLEVHSQHGKNCVCARVDMCVSAAHTPSLHPLLSLQPPLLHLHNPILVRAAEEG